MRTECRSFRALLERELSGALVQRELVELSWHTHLVGCGDCKALLEAEEALELLLAQLPAPHLPPELARRVVSRLRAGRMAEAGDARLDALLDLDALETPPARLASSVLEGLRAERRAPSVSEQHASHDVVAAGGRRRILEKRLDTVLDLDREIAVPADLSARVLAGLRAARRARTPTVAWLRTRAVWLAAALVLALVGISFALWTRAQRATEPRDEGLAQGQRAPSDGAAAPVTAPLSAPEPGLLAALEVLEQWDLLMHEDVDVLLSTLEPLESEPLDTANDEPVEPPPAETNAAPSKG